MKVYATTWKQFILYLPVFSLPLVFGLLFSNARAVEMLSPSFTPEQAAKGKQSYVQKCASCHGSGLDNGQFARPVKGDEFLFTWGGKSAAALIDYIDSSMPPTEPGTLARQELVNLLAYLLQENNVTPGKRALSSDPDKLQAIVLPAPAHVVGWLATDFDLPPPPEPLPNPLLTISPVTEKMLSDPPPADWLNWRRTADAGGFSPLTQINRDTVARLGIRWAWALPNGPNEMTPLVHDGVMFVYGHGDIVQALNAVTGDLLWQYSRRLPAGRQPSFKKSMALYGDMLYVATSDVHVVALDVKSGKVIWDESVGLEGKGFNLNGGPLVAKGHVIVGTVTRHEHTEESGGGNYIVALDAMTGKLAWRFATVARPGDPGGNSWNGLPVEEIVAGSVWTPGSYDPELETVYFGPAPTYDTGPMLYPVNDGKSTNDALYTDTTLALDPDNGRIKWYFQHLANDQMDLDWSFERHILNLEVDGVMRRVVLTAGKPALYDALDARTGKYLFSIDLGLQNFITAIDPVTGRKTVDPTKLPSIGKVHFVCPHVEGGKNWTPSTYDPRAKVLVSALTESCMDVIPMGKGKGFLTTDVRPGLRPRPDSDGRYGRLQAIDLASRKTLWMARKRAPFTTGVLGTAGGLVFAGALDRFFSAYDSKTGERLWQIRLDDVPASNAISYAVEGKQYIAIISGGGSIHATMFARLVPEIKNPPHRSATVWVFELK